MLGISFRIFCGLCDSEVDFKSLGFILVVFGWLLGCIFWSLELPLERLGPHLGGLGVLWASILGVWGCPWAPSACNRLKRPLVPFSAAPF